MALEVLTRGRSDILGSTGRRLDVVATRRWTLGEIWLAGLLMVAAQLAFRAWMVYPAWFFLDDYVYLHDAPAGGPTWAWVLSDYNGHLMPAARLLISLVAGAGPISWATAATTSLVLQGIASVACLWSLLRLFGPRPGVLLPHALFLTTVITVPGFVWWAAAINLVAVQATLFVAVAAWVEHLRSRRRRWLLLTVVAVLVGMAFDVRGVLTLPVLAVVALVYFASGGLLARVRLLARRHLLAWTALVLVGGAYTAYYLTAVEQVTEVTSGASVLQVSATMLGVALPSAMLGGPWQWYTPAPPTGVADPPLLLLGLSWLVLLLLGGWLAARRRGTLRAWLPALGYVLALAYLVASTRGTIGGIAGREYRFLTESACLLVIGLGLALFTLPGATGSSAPRSRPVAPPAPRWMSITLVVVVLVGGVASSTTYARTWHGENASKPYVQELAAGLAASGSLEIADQRTPEDVLSSLVYPRNRTSTIAAPLSDLVDFPRTSDDLTVVDEDGALQVAVMDATTRSLPGPTPGCGWRLPAPGDYRIALAEEADDELSWLRLGYLTGPESAVTVTAGSTVVQTELTEGVGGFFMQHAGGFEEVGVQVTGRSDVCVDTIEVGDPVPGGPR